MITIQPFDKKYSSGFIATGHAEYAEHGADIVCSAVSAMTQMTLASLMRHSTVVSNVEPGDMRVEILDINVYTNVLMESMIRGLRAIAQQKPDYVQLLEEKR